MTWDITNNLYDEWHIKFNNGFAITYVPKGRIYMTVDEPYLTINWTDTEIGEGGLTRRLVIDFNDVSSLPASAAALETLINGYNTSGFSGGTVQSVTGLDTDNTDPANPIVQIAVDGVTITGDGTLGNPLVATASGGGYTIINVSTTPYTVVPVTGQTIYIVDATAGNITMDFPTAVGNTAEYTVLKQDSSANSVTIDPFGAQTINGNATQTLKFQNTSIDIYSDNANLFIR